MTEAIRANTKVTIVQLDAAPERNLTLLLVSLIPQPYYLYSPYSDVSLVAYLLCTILHTPCSLLYPPALRLRFFTSLCEALPMHLSDGPTERRSGEQVNAREMLRRHQYDDLLR